MHKHNFGQTLILQSAVVTLNIRSRSFKSNSLFFVSKQITCIYASLVQKNTFGSEDRAHKRLNLHFLGIMTLKWGDLESKVNVIKIISTLHFVTMIQYMKFS